MAVQQKADVTRKGFVAPMVEEHPSLTELTQGGVAISGGVQS